MIRKFVQNTLKVRHYWRKNDYDELGELYVTTFFRGLSISMVGLFVPIYMLRLHYSIASILMMVALSNLVDQRELFATLGRYLEWLVPGQSVAVLGEVRSTEAQDCE